MRDIEMVRQAVLEGEDLVLVDVRRTGKTTVGLCALELLDAADVLVFSVDLAEGAPSSVDVAQRLATQIAGYSRRWKDQARRIEPWIPWIRERGVGAITAFDEELGREIEAALELLEPADRNGAEQISSALDRIDALAADQETRAVVFIDEVQELVGWSDSDAVQRELKGRLRKQGGRLSLLFAGSRPSIVDSLFRRGGLLDYQGNEMPLSPISPEAWTEGLQAAFRSLGCEIEDRAIDEILEASGCAPLRTMIAARELHSLAQAHDGERVADYGKAVVAVGRAQQSHLWNLPEEQ